MCPWMTRRAVGVHDATRRVGPFRGQLWARQRNHSVLKSRIGKILPVTGGNNAPYLLLSAGGDCGCPLVTPRSVPRPRPGGVGSNRARTILGLRCHHATCHLLGLFDQWGALGVPWQWRVRASPREAQRGPLLLIMEETGLDLRVGVAVLATRCVDVGVLGVVGSVGPRRRGGNARVSSCREALLLESQP